VWQTAKGEDRVAWDHPVAENFVEDGHEKRTGVKQSNNTSDEIFRVWEKGHRKDNKRPG
jgi:hypothetical protein